MLPSQHDVPRIIFMQIGAAIIDKSIVKYTLHIRAHTYCLDPCFQGHKSL